MSWAVLHASDIASHLHATVQVVQGKPNKDLQSYQEALQAYGNGANVPYRYANAQFTAGLPRHQHPTNVDATTAYAPIGKAKLLSSHAPGSTHERSSAVKI